MKLKIGIEKTLKMIKLIKRRGNQSRKYSIRYKLVKQKPKKKKNTKKPRNVMSSQVF